MVVRSLLLLVVAVASLQASRAAACTREAAPSITGFQVLPADGSRVPRSTAIWLRSDQSIGGELIKDISALLLVDERGKRISLTPTQVRVTGEAVATLFVLRPSVLLDGTTNYRLELNGAVISKFVTSDEIDMKPPELPKAKVADVKADTQTASSCGAPSQVTVQLEAPGEINFLVAGTTQTPSMPASALAITTTNALTAVAVPTGLVELRVAAFDLSGNMAMSSEKLTTYLPGDAGVGCSATALTPFALLGLLTLIRRR